MRRILALRAEVVRLQCESLAHEHLPIAVDGDAGDERVLLGKHPLCQAEAVAFQSRGHRASYGRYAGSDDFARKIVLAASENRRIARRRALLKYHHRWCSSEGVDPRREQCPAIRLSRPPGVGAREGMFPLRFSEIGAGSPRP